MSFIFKAAAECQQFPHTVCPEDADLTFFLKDGAVRK
jgi:hypothetical protein